MNSFEQIPGISELADMVDAPGYNHKKAMQRLDQINDLAEARCKAIGSALHADMLHREAATQRAHTAQIVEASASPVKAITS